VRHADECAIHQGYDCTCSQDDVLAELEVRLTALEASNAALEAENAELLSQYIVERDLARKAESERDGLAQAISRDMKRWPVYFQTPYSDTQDYMQAWRSHHAPSEQKGTGE
jgi:hypothetical protein